MNKLEIYRAGSIIANIDIDDSTVFTERLQGTRFINCVISRDQFLDLQEGDYLFFEDETLVINILPDVDQDGASPSTQYTIVFEALFYQLIDLYVRNSFNKLTFPYYGTALDHLTMILAKTDGTWSIGQVDETEPKLIDYDSTYIRTALDTIADTFKLEWDVKNKTVSIVAAIGRDTGIVFELGRGKGLHQIKRSSDTSKTVVNRVFGKGGTKNINAKYRDGTYTYLTIDGDFIETPEVSAGIERPKEGTYTNEERYPHFEGSIESVDVLRDTSGEVSSVSFVDANIDFNINTQLQEGITAKIAFLSGVLTGVEFEMYSYDVPTKRVTLINNTDSNNYILPNNLNLPAVGDTFTILDVVMPTAYVTAEQNKLREEMVTFLEENRYQRLLYGVKPDPKVLRGSNIRLRAGDRATVIDAKFGVDEVLRFTEVSFPLSDRYNTVAVVGNEIRYDRVTKLYADVLQNTQKMADIDRMGQEIAKRGAKNLRSLESSIFDTDGNFDSDKLNIGVISAMLGIFGAQSSNFLLNKVYITANFGSDPNSVNITTGEMFHLEYSNPGNQNIWQLQGVTQNGLVTGQGYYVYSKISKTNQTGTFLVTTDQIKVDDLAGFYTLRTGFIYPQIDGWRDADFTYGITSINGRQIKTGIIQGNTGALKLNLDTGEIFGKLTFRSNSGGTIKDVAIIEGVALSAEVKANQAEVNANNAASQAQTALVGISQIASDSYLDAGEKQQVLKERAAIQGEYQSILSQANTYGVSTADYINRYNQLISYLAPLLADTTVNTPIVRATFIANFTNYYNARQALLSAVTTSAKGLIDSINIGAKNMLRNSNFIFGNQGWNTNGSTAVVSYVVVDGRTAVKIKSATYGDGINTFTGIDTLEAGVTYNISFDIKGVFYENLKLAIGFDTFGFKIISVPNEATWNRVSFDVISSSSGQNPFVIYGTGETGGGAGQGDQEFYITDIKVEKGSIDSGWSANPSDIQQQLTIAIAQSNLAIAELNEIASDAILSPNEKPEVLKEIRIILGEIGTLEDQGIVYGVNITIIDNAYRDLKAYVEPLVADMTTSSPIVRDTFIAKFTTYYNAKTALLKAITDRANSNLMNVALGGRNYLNNSDFSKGLQSWSINGSGSVVASSVDGKTAIYVSARSYGDGAFSYMDELFEANTEYAISFDIRGGFYDQLQLVVGLNLLGQVLITVPNNSLWTRVKTVVRTNARKQGDHFIIYGTGGRQEFWVTNIKLERGNKGGDWSPSVSDMKEDAQDRADVAKTQAVIEANAFAEQVSTAKANSAQANAQFAATQDATAKANAAQANAINASNAYSNIAASNAASAAQIAAAADASNKATAAFNAAEANRVAQYNALTGSLRTLAYRDFNTTEGVTMIDGGQIITMKIDVAYLRANVINAGYINTLELEATKGTIGGWDINAQNLGSYGDPATPIGSREWIELVSAERMVRAVREVTGYKFDYQNQIWVSNGQVSQISSYMNPSGLVIRSDGNNLGITGVRAAGHFEAWGNANQAIYASANNSSSYAAYFNGRIQVNDGGGARVGVSVRVPYTAPNGSIRHMTYVNGVMVEEGAGA